MDTRRLAAALFVVMLTVAGCATNPVTGKREVQFISERSEIAIGQENYAPMRQSEGGDFDVMPELTAYVDEVGQKLAAVSDRKLPYEFVVLNNSVPNAWALPGGKIAVNRGLLTTLENESELAAVLGHEIVHAAARHGAKAQERGTLMQVGMVAAQIGMAVSDTNPQLGQLVLQGAGLGAQLTMTKYGRDAELESDLHGMRYMQAAGYDPAAAVSLQQKFVELSRQHGGASGNQGWLEGLFASHPPSEERVARNQQTLTQLPPGGEMGTESYRTRLGPLRAVKPAYDKADAAVGAASNKDFATARQLASEAVQLYPKEAAFVQLLGDLAMAEEKPAEALTYYEKAVALNSDFFGAYLGGGVASFKQGDKAKARDWLSKSNALLPTAPATYYLGMLAKESGDRAAALQLFKQAASSQSELGQSAAAEYVRMDLPQNPGNYVQTRLGLDSQGRVVIQMANRAPIELAAIALTVVRVDPNLGVVESGRPIRIDRVLKPGEQVVVDSGLGAVPPELAQSLRVRIDGAEAR